MDCLNNILSTDILNKVRENIYVVLKRSMLKFYTNMPRPIGQNGVYAFEPNFYDDWHVGFWAGIYYMAHEMFGDKTFLTYAESITDTLQQKTIGRTIYEHPDEGFIYMPSCVNSFKINRNYESIETLCMAADRMVKSHLGDDNRSLHIKLTKPGDITNLNLLRLVAAISNNERYVQIADSFENEIIKNNIDSDGNCVMRVYLNKEGTQWETDEKTNDGRAYVWMLHGLAMRYANTKSDEYLDLFQKTITKYISKFFVSVLNGSDSKNRQDCGVDTTSISILNCAVMELVKKLEPGTNVIEGYLNILKYNLNFIISEYLISCEKNSQGLVDGGSLSTLGNKGINGSTVMGDYFFIETLMHLDSSYKSCWDIDHFIKYISK